MMQAIWIDRRPLEAAKPVDEQPADLALTNGLQQPLAEGVQQIRGRRLPDDLDLAALELRRQRRADTPRLGGDAGRRLIEAEQEAAFLVRRFCQEMQAQRRLAAYRRAPADGRRSQLDAGA